MPQTPEPSTVLASFDQLRARHPNLPLYTWVDDHGRDQVTLTFAQTWEAAAAVAAHLTSQCGLKAGERVLLVYPPSLDFVVTFVGCLIAGIVPAPIYPPNPLKLKKDLATFQAIATNCQAAAVLTNKEYARARLLGGLKAFVGREGVRWPDLPWHTVEGVKPRRQAAPTHVAKPDDVAFLQYTSGSTSTPKGVMITHANVLAEAIANARDLNLRTSVRCVFWVPQYHDFGLISGILSALAGNGHLYMMSPFAFAKRPAVWLEVMSRVRATHSATPNFGLELAVRKTTPEQRASWDLSALEAIVCAAEPVRASTLEAFHAAFAPSGMRPGVVFPSYGLAEHTVSVTVGGKRVLKVSRLALREGRAAPPGDSDEAVPLVACGRVTKPGLRVRIVEPQTRVPLADGQIGEIWVDSPTKAAGYYGRESESRELFQARVADPSDDRGYLRTGDLGFLWEGELYPTGRSKDLIIVRGRNYYPQDIEDGLRNAHPAVRPGGLLAFAAPDAAGEEGLVVVAELQDGAREPAEVVARAIRDRVFQDHQLGCSGVVIGQRGTVPKTTSGKLRRQTCREDYLSGALERASKTLHVARFAPEAPEPASDRRLQGLDPSFERLIADVGPTFMRLGKARGGRAFHKLATTLAGQLQVVANPALPAHAFFVPGRKLPVLVRHANGVQDDDAGPDNRGATLRVLDPAHPEALDAPKLDLLLTTGRCFLQRTAADFARWMAATPEARDAWIAREPRLGQAGWEMFRRATSYASLYYYGKVASHYVATDGTRHSARFRLVPAARTPEDGFVAPDGRALPPDVMPREPGDTRARDFLHTELRERIGAGGVDYVLQAQVRPASGEASDDEALDCTRPWPEDAHPWHDVATLHLDSVLEPSAIEPLTFNPANAPADLAMPLSPSPDTAASLNHLRSLVYDMSAAARQRKALPPALQAVVERGAAPRLEHPAPVPARARPRRVCVIGAGVSGLTAARELEKLGHHVTVLERQGEVGGKCGSVQLGGRWYDLGGHVCTARYVTVARMVAELGLSTMPVTPARPFDLVTGQPSEMDGPTELARHWLRYVQTRERDFPGILSPGLAPVARTLGAPVAGWLATNGLEGFARHSALMYTSCGYGYVQEPELPALYFLKFAELLVGAPPDAPLPRFWTIEQGFLKLWKTVAAGLRDLRLNTSVRAVERLPSGVRVHTATERLEFDELVVATPLHEVPPFLSPTPEEREIFGKVRHYDYYTTIVSAEGLPEDGFFLLQPHASEPGWEGRSVAVHQRYPGDGMAVAYAYGKPGVDDGESIVRRLREDLGRMGGRMGEVHTQLRWDYFPHFGSEDIANGIYDRLEGLQGQNHTFYVGSLLNFELVECNVAYATALVERHFSEKASSEAVRVPAVMRSPAPALPVASGAMLETVQRLLQEELELAASPSPDTEFAALGFDSLRAMSVLQRVSTVTGQSLEPNVFFDHPTVEQLSAHLARAASAPLPLAPAPGSLASNAWLAPVLPAPRMRLFCFHHAGGSAELFARWPEQLPRDIEVRALQLPGRLSRAHEAACTDMEALLQALEGEIVPLLDRPFAFFGHSLGGIVAFELTRRLRRAGHPLPSRLLLSAIAAPKPGKPVRHASDEELARAGAWLTPLTRSDLRIFRSWQPVTEAPLEVPITVLGGKEDLLATPQEVVGWHHQTRGDFEVQLLPGGHFFPLTQEAELVALVARRLAQVPVASERPRQPVLAAGTGEDAEALGLFATRWRTEPSSYEGPYARYNLAWVARSSGPDGRPLFPDALEALVADLAAPAPGPTAQLPASDYITALAVANTLLRWKVDEESITRALEQLFGAVARMGTPARLELTSPYGRHFQYHGLFAYWLSAVLETETLLSHVGGRLDAAQVGALEALIAPHRTSAARRKFEGLDHARCFANNAVVLGFAEHFPPRALQTPEAREHARRMVDLPPAAARHAEATGEPALIARLRGLLARPLGGLWPTARLPEVAFSLYYLARAGIDVQRHFAEELAFLGRHLGEDGIPVYEGAAGMDCDTTATAACAALTSGLPVRFDVERLHGHWVESRRCYLAWDGEATPAVSTEIHVLEATLAAPGVSRDRQRAVWQRTIRLLEERPWREPFHLSPFYVWELVASMGFRHAHLFPEVPTSVHFEALERILENQAADGGFQSAYTDAPNQEETALALTALRSALGALPPGASRQRAQAAAEAASAYLRRAISDGACRPPALWTAKVLMAPPHLIQAVVLSSLSGWERGETATLPREPRSEPRERLEQEAAELRRRLEELERQRARV
ncbi:FAD-dependent oxidoreductase [Archangium gephyra]|uniref:FAD-dependent oxidoreductase n=1 Tax=Archangium gephyra TaxID=48 RepID=UPI0035D4E5A1